MTFTPDLRLRAAVVVDGGGSFRPGFHLPISLHSPFLLLYLISVGEMERRTVFSRQIVVERVVLAIFAKIK